MPLPADLLARPGLTAGHPVGYGAWRIAVQMYLPPAAAGQWDVDEWDGAEWGGSSWVDITRYVRGIEWTRGSSEFGGRPEVGSATLTLDNTARLFSPIDPTNSFGGFVEVVAGAVVNQHYVPGRLARIVCHNPDDPTAAGFVPQFTGTVETWEETRLQTDRESYVTATLVETLADLAAVDETALAALEGDNETAPDRLERLADAAGWTYGYDHHLGTWADWPLQSTDMANNRLAEIYLTADSVGAVARSARDGRLVAYAKSSPPAGGPTSAPVCWLHPALDLDPASFLADPAEVVWLTDLDPIVNFVELARAGGTIQTASDATSIALHRRRTFGRNDLINKSDALTLDLAEAAVYTNPLRLAELQVDGHADNRALGALISVDVHNTITVHAQALDGGVLTLEGAQVDGMTHQVTPVHETAPVRWTATYALGAQSAPTYTAP